MFKIVNEEIFDVIVCYQIRLLCFFQGEVQKFVELLVQSDVELVVLLQLGFIDILEVCIRGFLIEVCWMCVVVVECIQVEFEEDMEGFFKIEVEWEVFMFQGVMLIVFFFNVVFVMVVKVVVGFFINGILFQGWFGKMVINDVVCIEQQIRLGVFQGEIIDQMVCCIRGIKVGGYKDGVLEIICWEVEMIVCMVINYVFIVVCQVIWDVNVDVIKGVWWVVILDGCIFFVCQSWDGEVYLIDKGLCLLVYLNCCLIVVFVLYGEEIVGDWFMVIDICICCQCEIDFWVEVKEVVGDKWKGMFVVECNVVIKVCCDKWVDENIGQIFILMNYQLWLKGQFKEFQDEVLGKGKVQFFWDGLLLEKFVDEKGKFYFLVELKVELEGDKLNVIQFGVGLKVKLLLQQGMLFFEVLDQIKQEFLDVFILVVFIVFYKFELNKVGVLNLGFVFKVFVGVFKQVKVVVDVVVDLDVFLLLNLKYVVGGQWFIVVDDLDGLFGVYGYYQVGKGVVLSGKKLFVLLVVQVKQVVVYEFGYLFYKQYDLLFDLDVLVVLKVLVKGLFLDVWKFYLYYLMSVDEFVVEVYGQVLSLSVVMFQGFFVIEFNKVFGFVIQVVKDVMVKKFFVFLVGVKVLFLGGFVLLYEVVGKYILVGLLVKVLLQQGMLDDQVLKVVFVEFLEVQIKQVFIVLYKFQLKKDGLLFNKVFGLVVVVKFILDVVFVFLFGVVVVVVFEVVVIQFVLIFILVQLKDEVIKLMQKGMFFNQDLVEILVKQFFVNVVDVKVINIVIWKFNWKKLSFNFYNYVVLFFEKVMVKEVVLGFVQKFKLVDQKFGGMFFFVLDKVKFVLVVGGGLQDVYEVMKLVFGVIKQFGVDDLLELVQYQLVLVKVVGKFYLNVVFIKLIGFVFNGKIEKFMVQLFVSGKVVLEVYKKVKQQGLGLININKLVKKMVGYEFFVIMKVKLKEVVEYEFKKQGMVIVFFNEVIVVKKQGVVLIVVDMMVFWLVFILCDGFLLFLRYLGVQCVVGVCKFVNGLLIGDLVVVNVKQ